MPITFRSSELEPVNYEALEVAERQEAYRRRLRKQEPEGISDGRIDPAIQEGRGV